MWSIALQWNKRWICSNGAIWKPVIWFKHKVKGNPRLLILQRQFFKVCLLWAIDFYKSTLAPTMESGMAFISVLIHKNSPHTVIMAHPITFRIHHGSVCGMWRLNIQHPRKCKKCVVTAKSRHNLALWTIYHIATALENKEYIVKC